MGGMSMERPIGEVFEYKDKVLQVVEQSDCKDCFFDIYFCCRTPSIVGRCYDRKDGKSVIFKKVNDKTHNEHEN